MADDAAARAARMSPQATQTEAGVPVDVDVEPEADTGPRAATESGTGVAVENGADADVYRNDADNDHAEVANRWTTPRRLGLLAGLITLAILVGLTGWLGYSAYQSQRTESDHQQFLQAARQGAINLTTIDYEHADADIQRILDSATGQFYDDFAKRSQPFVAVVKQAQSKSEGKVTAAGLESTTRDQADALIAVTVDTTIAGAPEQAPRLWRMRMTVQKVGDEDVKVSNVVFVP